MRAIEHSVEEEPLIKKARVIDKVENCYEVPMLSLNETAVDGNEQVSLLDVEEKNETCVASGDGSRKSGEVESNERKIEEVSVLSLADRKDVVSGGETIGKLPVLEVEKNKEASVISAVTRSDEVPVVESNDSCVALSGIRGESGSNSSVLKKKLLVLDLNGLLADIVTPLKDVPADINIGRRASEFQDLFFSLLLTLVDSFTY